MSTVHTPAAAAGESGWGFAGHAPAPRKPRCATDGCGELEVLHKPTSRGRGACSRSSCRCQRWTAPQLAEAVAR